MEEIRETLAAMEEDAGRAAEILDDAITQDRTRIVTGLAAFVLAALAGVVVGPGDF